MGRARERRAGLTCTLICCTLLMPLAVHFFLPLIPEVKAHFTVSDGAAQFTLSATLFTMAAASIVLGPVSDRWGRRPLMLAGLVFFIAGAVICTFSETISWLIVGRICQAVGAATGLVLVRAIGHDVFGPEKLTHFIALITMAYAVGVMTFPPVAGLLIAASGWRAAFFFAALCAVVILVLVSIFLSETHLRDDPDHPPTRRIEGYLLLVRDARYGAFIIQPGFTNIAFFGHAAAASVLMRELLHRPAHEFGLYFIMVPAAFWLGTFYARRMAGKRAIETMVLAGSFFTLAGAVILVILMAFFPITPLSLISPGMLIAVGHGISMPNANSGAINRAPHHAGTASSGCVFADLFFSGLGVLLVGLFANGTTGPMMAVVFTSAVLSFFTACIVYTSRRPTAARSRQH